MFDIIDARGRRLGYRYRRRRDAAALAKDLTHAMGRPHRAVTA